MVEGAKATSMEEVLYEELSLLIESGLAGDLPV
jgi:hypothetical protein